MRGTNIFSAPGDGTADGVAMTNPIGSGPFRYIARAPESGHRVVFDSNPDNPPLSDLVH